MKKFKKLAALVVAVVTLAATSITTCAEDGTLYLGPLEPAYYYTYAPSFHVFDSPLNLRNIVYSNVKGRLMEGNKVLSIDFSDPNATGKEKVMKDCWRKSLKYYLPSLRLLNTDGKFITEDKYPVVVDLMTLGHKGRVTMMLERNLIFREDCDITKAYFINRSGATDCLTISYKINDNYVLPSFNITLRECVPASDWILVVNGKRIEEFVTPSNPATYTLPADNHWFGDIDLIDNPNPTTTGNVTFHLPSKHRGGTFDILINGERIGRITIPYTRSYASYINYNN